ncbi:hypothetical protein LguiB_000445 [Lonicera macranthoides]
MNGVQNGKNRNLEKPFPGCLGRMVNLFDLSTGVPGNRLLTDKPHYNGSPLSRTQSDVSEMSPIRDHTEDKGIVSELRRTSSNRKADRKPVKMLIAQEMVKEVESKHNPSNLVAKLMGLDALPQHQPYSDAQRSHSTGYSHGQSEIPLGHWQQEHGFLDTQVQPEIHHYSEWNEYKYVYEIWPQSPNSHYVRGKSPQTGRYCQSTNEKKMALVRQKFIEAKRLATDENLRQSKQFQEALEVLSSNKDLFLKFLQEPNSLFSQHLYNFQSIPPPSETKRITVLRPSKMVTNNKFVESEKNNEKQNSNSRCSPPTASCSLDDSPTKPTRIVVLKPGPGKHHDIKAIASQTSSPLRTLHGEEFYGESSYEERESREVAKEITRQMHKNLSGHRRDETLISSVFSNGYIGDESSFDKSEMEYTEGHLSDSEDVSSASRHAWDYINRFCRNSPCSSSISRASYSPESSVCREAKKRLSERWAVMASNNSGQEQRYMRKSSSTLGEMLALSDMKKSVRSEEEGSSNKEQEPRGSTSCLIGDLSKDEVGDNSPRNFHRSKSLPVSSKLYSSKLNSEISSLEVSKIDVPKELTKTRSVKSSFKGKVSSLFFPKNRKPINENSGQSKDEPQSAGMRPEKIGEDRRQCVNGSGLEGFLTNLHGSRKGFSPDLEEGILTQEAGFSVTKSVVPGNPSENQEQPSPISVLEPPFEEDSHAAATPFPCNINADRHAVLLPAQSNLIDKSPPIGSIARTLSWDHSCAETASLYPSRPSKVSLGSKDYEQECFFFVQTLLSAARLDDVVPPDSFLTRWHSPESPLDPSLRDRYTDAKDKDSMHEANRRQLRSTRKLVFDCVNVALVDLAGYGSETCQRAILCNGPRQAIKDHHHASLMVDRVWDRMKGWFLWEVGDGGDNNDSLVVERVVRKEVVGTGWAEHLRLETDNLRKEIEVRLLEELVHEAMIEFTGRVQ